MVKQTVFRAGSIALILTLGACSWFQQPAAPVISGTTDSSTTDSTASGTNPYGAAPYTPGAGESASTTPAPYSPPVSAGTGGAYIPSNAPVDINAATHTVVRGDTVYNISKRYSISQDNIRAWNNLPENAISVGQVLRVKPDGYTAGASSSNPVATVTPPVVVSSTPATTPTQTAPTASTPAVAAGSTRTVSGITWQRPTSGNVIANFGGASKGVDIAGTAGQAVVSAADGKVVYSGSGLRGYGNLVIVQHNPTFLTAYGHNQALLVKEGQTVKRGQAIARMGNSDADRTKLHFEVRQNGKPVNPTTYVAF